MKRLFVLLSLLLVTAACGNDVIAPVEQQNVLTRLTRAAGYEVWGMPHYKDGRWMSNVRIPGCNANITVAAQEAEETIYPVSFTVLSIDGKPLTEVSPETDGLFLLAKALKASPEAADQLRCIA